MGGDFFIGNLLFHHTGKKNMDLSPRLSVAPHFVVPAQVGMTDKWSKCLLPE